jgi:hypothetical protein
MSNYTALCLAIMMTLVSLARRWAVSGPAAERGGGPAGG